MKIKNNQDQQRSHIIRTDAGEALIVGLLTFPIWFSLYRYGPLGDWIKSLETCGIYAVFGTIMLTYIGIYIVLKITGLLVNSGNG